MKEEKMNNLNKLPKALDPRRNKTKPVLSTAYSRNVAIATHREDAKLLSTTVKYKNRDLFADFWSDKDDEINRDYIIMHAHTTGSTNEDWEREERARYYSNMIK